MKASITLLTLILFSVRVSAAPDTGITSAPFGKIENGTPVTIYTLRNASGMEARIMDYGGSVVSLTAPDRHGVMGDMVLGYDKLDDYLKIVSYLGALTGRYAGRIGGGKFDLDGKHYQLSLNDRPNTLHGGYRGFDREMWTATPLNTKDGPALQLTYLSKDGEEGFPGNLSVTATYTLTNQNELRLDFKATTDKPTVLNLSNHTYFNLAGQGQGDMLNHVLTIKADKFLVLDDSRIPTGELRSVDGTPFDFKKPATIGSRIDDNYQQIALAGGYDHCWAINKKPGELALAAKVVEPKSGRVMEVLSTEPGLLLFTRNGINDGLAGKGGTSYPPRCAFAMEPGHFPDSPNHPDFPTTVLRPGETFTSTIIYRFSTE